MPPKMIRFLFGSYFVLMLSTQIFALNLILLSSLIWPGEVYHAFEIAILVSTSLAMKLFSPIFGKWIDTHARTRFIRLMFGLAMLGHLIFFGSILVSGSFLFWVFFAGQIIFGLSRAMAGPLFNSLSNDLIGLDHRTQYYANYSTVMSFGEFLGLILSAFTFTYGIQAWYFAIFILGYAGCFIVGIKIEEPVRGEMQVNHVKIPNTNESSLKIIPLEQTKKILFSRSNKVMIFEEFLMSLILASYSFLFYSYIQSPPVNVSSFVLSIFGVIITLIATATANALFAKRLDQKAKINPRIRVYCFILSVLVIYLMILFNTLIPVPEFSINEGNDIAIVLANGLIWGFLIIILILRIGFVIYSININPLLQQLNIPSTQAQISAYGQMFNVLGMVIGQLIAALILENTAYNYLVTFNTTIIVAIIAIGLYGYLLRVLEQDLAITAKILQQ